VNGSLVEFLNMSLGYGFEDYRGIHGRLKHDDIDPTNCNDTKASNPYLYLHVTNSGELASTSELQLNSTSIN